MTPPAPPPDALTALLRVTDAALAYLPLDELLIELLKRIAEILAVDTAAILLLDEGRRARRPRRQGHRGGGRAGRADPARQGLRRTDRRRARARSSIVDVDHADILNPILREKGIRSLLGVPLLVEGRVIGVLHVGSLTPREFDDADRDLLQLAAERAGLAIEQARLFRAAARRRGAAAPPAAAASCRVPGLELAARYLPAAGERHRRRLVRRLRAARRRASALVIGDVVGHGVAAAALMAQMRTALRAYAVDGHPPAGVIGRVNRRA